MRTRITVRGGIFDGKIFDLNCGVVEAVFRVYSDLNLYEDGGVTLETETLY